MKIFVDRFLSDQYFSGSSLFIKNLMEELARRNPDHSFLMPAGPKQTGDSNLAPNITIYPVNGLFLQGLGKKWWYRFTLPALLRKQQVSLFVAVDSTEVPRSAVPACLLVTALPSGNDDGGKGERAFHRKFADAARHLAGVIGFSRGEVHRLREQHPGAARSITHLQLAPVHPVTPLTPAEQAGAREQFAAGLEYFAFAGDLSEDHQLTNLLKAFSVFKKWQRSNMRLVLAGSRTAGTSEWMKQLDTYKYRAEVLVLPDPDASTLRSLIGGAYAFMYPARHPHLPVHVLHAMLAGVPVIASSIPAISEIAGQAVQYAATSDANGFATAMQALYKDENLRDSLIARGKKQTVNNIHDLADDCWHIFTRLSQRKSP